MLSQTVRGHRSRLQQKPIGMPSQICFGPLPVAGKESIRGHGSFKTMAFMVSRISFRPEEVLSQPGSAYRSRV